MDDHLGGRKNIKQHKKIPIYIVENHHEVVPYIQKNIGSKHLPLAGTRFIHFDSHPDMLIPIEMPAESVFDKQKLNDSLSIENWMLPLAYAGHFQGIIWIKPPWAHQINNIHTTFNIGSDKKSGTIRLDCKESYFVSECLYTHKNELENIKNIELAVFTIGNELIDENDDLVDIRRSVLKSNTIILDIDLDFFSTGNPFKRIYEKADLYTKLKEIYYFKLPLTKDDNTIADSVKLRQKQIERLKFIFEFLDKNKCMPEEDKQCDIWQKIDNLRQIMLEFYKEEDIDWLLVHDAGCTCDETELPDHISTMEEIKIMLKCFNNFLEVFSVPPIIITISRSTEDDYTPYENVEFIQNEVIQILKEKFNCDEPLLDYLDKGSE